MWLVIVGFFFWIVIFVYKDRVIVGFDYRGGCGSDWNLVDVLRRCVDLMIIIYCFLIIINLNVLVVYENNKILRRLIKDLNK